MKNAFKRVVASLLVAVMLFGSAPFSSLIDIENVFDIHAIAAETEYSIFPVTQEEKTKVYYKSTNVKFGDDKRGEKPSSHHNTGYAFDFYFDSSEYPIYAPFSGKVYIGADNNTNTVIFVSDGPVMLANGRIAEKAFVWFAHDNNLNVKDGQEIKQGEYIYNSGIKGLSKGDHVHMEVAALFTEDDLQKYSSVNYKNWTSASNLFLNCGLQPDDFFFVPEACTITCTAKNKAQLQKYDIVRLPKGEVIQSYYSKIKWGTKANYYYTTESLNMRSQPVYEASHIVNLPKGSKFIVLGEVLNDVPHLWYYAEYTDAQGKVHKGYIYTEKVAKSNESIPAATLTRAYEDGKNTVRPLDGRLHKKGESFRILGSLKSYLSNMTRVTAITVKYNTSTGAYDVPVCESSVSINTKNYTFTKSSGSNDTKSINSKLVFGGLDVGHYRFMMIVEDDSKCTLVDDAYFEVSDKIEKSQDGKASKPAKVKAPSAWSQLGEWVTSKVSSITSIVSSILSYKNELIDVSNMIAYADIPDDPNSGVGSGNSGNSSSSSSSASAPVSNGYKLGVYRTTSSDRLNIRKGPGTSYGFATTAIPKSSEIAVYEVSSNGWGKTKYNGVEGWVSMNYCTYVRELETVQKPDAPTVTLSTDANVPTGAIVSASWLGVPNADSYTAYLKDSNGAVAATSAGIKGNSVSFTVADAGVYTITVFAVNSKYSTESAPTAAFTVHAPLTVSFVDWDGRTETRTVPYGGAAIAPDAPTREGYDFTGWDTNYNKVTENITVKATYKIKTFTVKFLDRDGNLLEKAQRIDYGSSATPHSNTNPTTGWSFIGWDTNAWECVKENLVVKAVYAWTNKDLPVVVSNVTADLISGGYSVNYQLSCTDSVTNGRAVIALKTSEGKLITTTESDAFSLSSDSRNVPKNTYVPEPEDNSPASVVEVYIVKSFANAIPISEKATGSVDLHLQWSEWSTTKPADNLYEDVESRVEYRYRDKKFTTSTSKNLSGWTRYKTTSTQKTGSTTNATYAYSSDAMVRTVSTRVITTPVNKTQYKYSHYRHSSTYTYETSPKKAGSFTKLHETDWMDSPYPYMSQSTSYPDEAKYGVKKSTYCSGKVNGVDCGCYSWYNQQTRQVLDYNIYTTWYDWTETYYTYYFWQWGGYSSWSTSYVAATADREVETRTLYRYKNSSTGVTENTSGEVRTFSGNIDGKYAGEQATLFIYKITEASDWTGEFVGQTKIADDGSYSFTFKLREEPTVETGDFTVILGVEGCDKTMVVGTIEAPDPEYTVTFYDWDGTIVDQQTVTEGGTASVPESPVREGYRFTGWDTSLTNIGMDMELTARYIQNEYTVVFVDWTNKVVLTKQFMHGDYLVPPELTVPEGYKHTGWENVTLGETVVTGNMVLAAEFEKLTYEVSFYDFDNNLISTQTVEYGEIPNLVDAPEKDNHIFTEWVSTDNTTDNTSGQITLYPSYVFAETVADPVASVANGTYGEAQTVELTCETEGAVIYYTLDGSDPTEGGTEYTGPITIDRSTELKFCAYAFEKNDSEVVTNYYAINTGNTVSEWMLQEDIPDYVTEDSETYTTEYAVGYRYKDVVATSSYSNVLALENVGWSNEGFTYSEWSDWLIYEPSLEDTAYEVESQQPAAEEELRYLYNRFKYFDSESNEYIYTYEEIEGVDGEWEERMVETKLSVTGYVSGTQVKYYEVDGEQWFNQSVTTIEVVPDYLMYRYRTKEYTLTKWTEWTTDVPAEGETRTTEKDTVYRYYIPEMYIVDIVPDYSKFGTEKITFIVEANELIEINEEDYHYLGHDFVGFFTDTEFTNYWNHQTEKVTGNITLYPKYSAHTFDVIFVDYDGTVLSEETVDYGKSALAPEVAERDGYVFIGWDSDSFDYVTETMIVTAQYVTEDEYCKVSLSHSRYNLMVGTSFTLVATITPENAENKNLNWYTDDTNVAVVNDEGVVTGVNAGVAIVTVEAEATGEMVECLVTVSENPSESLCLIPGSKLGLDEENGLLRGVSNTDCTVESIKTEFMNADLVFTDKNGNILEDTALVGTGTVISFSNGGKVIDEVTVVVTGDMTGDGLVNNRDAAMITRYLVEKETADFAQMVAIDVNGDGYINNRDASMVSRYLVGKETI